MLVRSLKLGTLLVLVLTLFACATSYKSMAEYQQGKRYFEKGYYKHAMQVLLPLACDGNPKAQYAVGYLYYYGYGVAQDTDVGYFWINRAAQQHYPPAQEAVKLIAKRAAYDRTHDEE